MQEAANVVEIGVDANVNDLKVGAMKRCEYINGRPLLQKIQNHLAGYFAWVGAYTLCGNAMVRCENIDTFPDGLGEPFPTDGDKLRRDIFKASQTTERLRESVEMSPGLASPVFADRLNPVHNPSDETCV
jgi:hypothetical protein